MSIEFTEDHAACSIGLIHYMKANMTPKAIHKALLKDGHSYQVIVETIEYIQERE